jgi:hypothetical protein
MSKQLTHLDAVDVSFHHVAVMVDVAHVAVVRYGVA